MRHIQVSSTVLFRISLATLALLAPSLAQAKPFDGHPFGLDGVLGPIVTIAFGFGALISCLMPLIYPINAGYRLVSWFNIVGVLAFLLFGLEIFAVWALAAVLTTLAVIAGDLRADNRKLLKALEDRAAPPPDRQPS